MLFILGDVLGFSLGGGGGRLVFTQFRHCFAPFSTLVLCRAADGGGGRNPLVPAKC